MKTNGGKRMHALAAIVTIALFAAATGHAQQRQAGRAGYAPPRTPWGHPDIEGVYTNKDEANIPLERPDALKGRSIEEFSAADLAALAKAAADQVTLIDLVALDRPDFGHVHGARSMRVT